ncbi:unnamed protein product [Ceutorhynchus assimilis]|uniref:Fatty acyl-CoA reductase n=1 Tax=Ceutorhynchus assimilis TaxID=467358 RepID=A0A9N9MX27_9CUCU|nr:unnamed protein product [Ceutorhynchus assimilis]
MNIYEQQGQDITALDMIASEEDSEIKKFYKDSCIFITGATGYLGKLVLEKLLRTCPDLKKVFILIRTKKGKNIEERLEAIFDEPPFDVLKRNDPNFRNKVHVVEGDVGLPDLGLNESDREKLIQEVDSIIHFAATVRFDEKLRLAAHINVRGVRDFIKLARNMKKLKVFLYVSTAFSNCLLSRQTVDEVFYEPPMTADKLLSLVDSLDDDQLGKITDMVIKDFPNTYTFTKCIAEDVLRKEGKNLPIAIHRPSIVIPTVKEPISGWIDNFYGTTGLFMAVGIGLVRTIRGKKDNKAEMIPADYVVNSCLATMWDVATIRSVNDNKEDQTEGSLKIEQDVPIYNCVSSAQNPLTWAGYQSITEKHGKRIPSEKCLWYYSFKLRANYYDNLLACFFLHTIPAYIVDFTLTCLGKKPMLVKGYQKINKFTKVIEYFTMNSWNFGNNNTQTLWKRMKKYDQELFDFDIEKLNWDSYIYTYCRGCRVYLLKDPLSTIPQGKKKYRKLFVLHYFILVVFWLLVFRLLLALFTFSVSLFV